MTHPAHDLITRAAAELRDSAHSAKTVPSQLVLDVLDVIEDAAHHLATQRDSYASALSTLRTTLVTLMQSLDTLDEPGTMYQRPNHVLHAILNRTETQCGALPFAPERAYSCDLSNGHDGPHKVHNADGEPLVIWA